MIVSSSIFTVFLFKDRKLESRSILCSDADGNITKVGAALGEMSGNMTEEGNTTSSTPCSPEKIPELTQECGASSKEDEGEKATEDTSSEVRDALYRNLYKTLYIPLYNTRTNLQCHMFSYIRLTAVRCGLPINGVVVLPSAKESKASTQEKLCVE